MPAAGNDVTTGSCHSGTCGPVPGRHTGQEEGTLSQGVTLGGVGLLSTGCGRLSQTQGAPRTTPRAPLTYHHTAAGSTAPHVRCAHFRRRSRPSEDCVLNCPGGRPPPPSPPAYPQCGSLSRQCGATAPRGLLAIPAWTPSPPASSRDEVRRVSGFGGRADWGTNGGRQRCQWRRGRAMG